MRHFCRTCYFCNEIATSREHVPPKTFFPEKNDSSPLSKDYRKNLLTVPSCKLHNNDKSNDDQYLLAILALIIQEKEIANNILKKVIKSFEHKNSFAKRVFKNTKKIILATNKNGLISLEETLALTIEIARIYASIKSIVKALYYHESNYESKWLNDITVTSPQLLKSDFSLESDRHQVHIDFYQHFEKHKIEKKGAHHEIFYYQIDKENIENTCIMKLVFYGYFIFFAVLI